MDESQTQAGKQLIPTSGPGITSRQFAALLDRAQAGNPEALTELRQRLDARPGLWEQLGDLATHARRSWLALYRDRSPLLHEALERRLATMREELLHERSSALERLLVDQLLTSWLQLQYADQLAAAAEQAGDHTLPRAEYRQRYQDRAQRRFLAAIQKLAQIQRLPRASLQLNIADKQVNLL